MRCRARSALPPARTAGGRSRTPTAAERCVRSLLARWSPAKRARAEIASSDPLGSLERDCGGSFEDERATQSSRTHGLLASRSTRSRFPRAGPSRPPLLPCPSAPAAHPDPPRARNRSYDVANHEPLTLSPGGPGGGEGSCIWRRSNRERLAGRRRKKFSLSPGEAGGPFDSAAAPPPLAQGARTVGVSGAATAARVSRPSPAPPLSRAPPSGPPPPSARRAASASPPRAAGRPPPARPTRSPSGSSR
jgi:hypothetical protein